MRAIKRVKQRGQRSNSALQAAYHRPRKKFRHVTPALIINNVATITTTAVLSSSFVLKVLGYRIQRRCYPPSQK